MVSVSPYTKTTLERGLTAARSVPTEAAAPLLFVGEPMLPSIERELCKEFGESQLPVNNKELLYSVDRYWISANLKHQGQGDYNNIHVYIGTEKKVNG